MSGLGDRMTTDPLDLIRRLRDKVERATHNIHGAGPGTVFVSAPTDLLLDAADLIENAEIERLTHATPKLSNYDEILTRLAVAETELTRLRAIEKAALAVESQYPKDDAPASIRLLRAALREKGAEE